MAYYQVKFIARGLELERYLSYDTEEDAVAALDARFPNDVVSVGTVTEVTAVPDTDPLYTSAMDLGRYFVDGT